VRLDGRLAQEERAADLGVRQAATNATSTSPSRSVSGSSRARAAARRPSCAVAANRSTSARVTEGLSFASPRATTRTALTTFTLVPRRGRVLAAKLVGAVLLGVGVMGFALAVAALATVGVAEVRDTAPVWGEVGRQVGGSLLASVLNIVMGAAFGALLGQTAVAIALFYVAPQAWALVGTAVFRGNAEWLDVYAAFGRLSEFEVAGHRAQIAVSVTARVVAPMLLGTLRSLRRNVS